MNKEDRKTLKFVEQLIKVLKENKVREYKDEKVNIVFDSVAFYQKPLKNESAGNPYGETF
ncbi:MAG TPA: hypothetical protein VIY47_08130 [Ignavibacteriaceae bacterium]